MKYSIAKGIGALIFALTTCPTLSSQKAETRIGYVIGASIVGTKSPCVFIGGVSAKSPAAEAGIKSGERILAVDGNTVTTVQDAAQLMRSQSAKPVTLQLVRDNKSYNVTVQRELHSLILKKNGLKTLKSGTIAPLYATEIEMSHKIHVIRQDRFADRVFPTHYPNDTKLYYPDFEIFVLKDPSEITVGGIEDGPASRSGIPWGDVITLVNGTDPRNKSVAELETLLSSQKAVAMTLTVDRAGVTKTFSFQLEQATTVLHNNQRQLIKDRPIPLGISTEYLSCFQ